MTNETRPGGKPPGRANPTILLGSHAIEGDGDSREVIAVSMPACLGRIQFPREGHLHHLLLRQCLQVATRPDVQLDSFVIQVVDLDDRKAEQADPKPHMVPVVAIEDRSGAPIHQQGLGVSVPTECYVVQGVHVAGLDLLMGLQPGDGHQLDFHDSPEGRSLKSFRVAQTS